MAIGTGGKGRRIGWVVLAILVVAGGALLLSIGPFDGNNGGASRPPLPPRPPATFSERKAERVETRSKEDPKDEALLLLTARRWIEAGNDRLSKIDYQIKPIPSVVPEDFRIGLRAWERYLQETGGKAPTIMAEQAGYTYFQLVEIGSTDPAEAEANAARSAQAFLIASKRSHDLTTLSGLVLGQYFSGEFAAGDKTAKEAAGTIAKAQSGVVVQQLHEYRESAEKFQERVKRGTESLQESGDEELSTPIKGYGSHAGINGYRPE